MAVPAPMASSSSANSKQPPWATDGHHGRKVRDYLLAELDKEWGANVAEFLEPSRVEAATCELLAARPSAVITAWAQGDHAPLIALLQAGDASHPAQRAIAGILQKLTRGPGQPTKSDYERQTSDLGMAAADVVRIKQLIKQDYGRSRGRAHDGGSVHDFAIACASYLHCGIEDHDHIARLKAYLTRKGAPDTTK